MNSLHNSLLHLAEELQRRVDRELAAMESGPEPGSCWDQAGLKDGRKIITEYVHVGEEGLALEHILYIITETGIDLTAEAMELLQRSCEALGQEVPVLVKRLASARTVVGRVVDLAIASKKVDGETVE